MCGYEEYAKDPVAHENKYGQLVILKALKMFVRIVTVKDFSKKYENLDDNDGDAQEQEMDAAQKKELMKVKKAIKMKVMDLFLESNHPYFIQNKDKSINTPVNTMDCIRIYQKCNELTDDPDCDQFLWSPLHLANFNLKDMTVSMNDKDFNLDLVRGKTYHRPRGSTSQRADASNCNLRGKWPKEDGEYARLWAKTEKGNENALPSIKEVVMGIYLHHMLEVDIFYNRLKDDTDPDRLPRYKENMRKAFNHLLICLEMGEYDVS